MNERLPDLLESNARIKVQVDGVTVGTRRTVNFTGATAGTDNGTTEVVSLGVGGGGYPTTAGSVQLTGQATTAATAATPYSQNFVYNSSQAPNDNLAAALGAPPADLGLSYALDSTTATITATANGVWAVDATALLGSPGTADSSPFQVDISTDTAGIGRGGNIWYSTTFNGVSASSIVALETGDTFFARLRVRPVGTQSIGAVFRTIITRLA